MCIIIKSCEIHVNELLVAPARRQKWLTSVTKTTIIGAILYRTKMTRKRKNSKVMIDLLLYAYELNVHYDGCDTFKRDRSVLFIS